DYLDVIFVGPIHPQKRPLDVIRALTIIKNENKFQRIKLHLVGEILSWALKREIEQLGSQFNIEIQFYGYVSNEKLLNLYSMADLAVFVPEMQPWGIFPLEAILAGIPTIISDQCGIKFILPDDFPVVRTGNVSQLADKILEIIDKYEIYKRLVNKISKDLSENYSWEKYSKRLETIFKAILDKNDNNIKF
ncbi:MAG: glycosyltransferase family 4 protein, partial [Archaeoglobaceae archaeon]